MPIRILTILLMLLSIGSVRADEPITLGHKSILHSEVLNEDRTLRIHLPPSYGWAAERRYPVLYLLDAQTAFLHTASAIDYLVAAGDIPEMIVVGIDSTVRIRDFTQTDWREAWVGGGGAANFKTFLSKELIPMVEGRFRTNGFRALSGHSASGQFVLYCLSSEPGLFQAYFAFSPSLDWDHNLPRRALEKALSETDKLSAFLYFAYSDDFGAALAEDKRLIQALETSAPRGFRWAGQAFPEESHMSVPLLASTDAVRKLFSGYRFSSDLNDQGIAFVQAHFDSVSKVVGYPLGIPEPVLNDLAYGALSGGKTADAIALFQRNVEANPSSASAWDGLADGFEKAGRLKEASQAVDRAVELATRFADPNRAYFEEHASRLRAQLIAAPKGKRPTKK